MFFHVGHGFERLASLAFHAAEARVSHEPGGVLRLEEAAGPITGTEGGCPDKVVRDDHTTLWVSPERVRLERRYRCARWLGATYLEELDCALSPR